MRVAMPNKDIKPTISVIVVNITPSARAGSIFNLGFGLVLDLGIFGTLDLSRQGCVNIGNIGGNAC